MKTSTNDAVIGFPRESTPGDRRTLLTPTVARALSEAGFAVTAEPGIATGIGCPDAVLRREGVRFADASKVWSAPLVLRYKCTDPEDLALLTARQSIGALFHAEGDPRLLIALTATGVTAYSYEFLAEGSRFPLGKPGGQIAGVQAVLLGAQALQSAAGRGVLLGGVPGAEPARVVVIGCGNVGSAAANTAGALGATVTVLARSAVSAASYERRAPGGVRVGVNTPELLRSCLAQADLVIGAILVSTIDTPPMIGETDLAAMQAGAVIVDATCGYGEGYLPTAGSVQSPGDPPLVVHGVLHVKLDTLPVLVPRTASQAYTANAAPYLLRLAQVVLRGVEDPVIASACIARDGAIVHPVCQQHRHSSEYQRDPHRRDRRGGRL
ncbi:MAG: NAD(P)-dependent oxidoreductase [Pseudonocardiaceae bacterium]